jgi:hypothetical protein
MILVHLNSNIIIHDNQCDQRCQISIAAIINQKKGDCFDIYEDYIKNINLVMIFKYSA